MAGTFNSDLYATAATIIPVLYLALAVQGQTFDAVSGWLYRVTLRMPGCSRESLITGDSYAFSKYLKSFQAELTILAGR